MEKFINIIMQLFLYINPYSWKEVLRIRKTLINFGNNNGGLNYRQGSTCIVPSIGSVFYFQAIDFLQKISFLYKK